MRFARVDITTSGSDPVGEIAESIRSVAPELGPGAIALIDSPRTSNAYPSQRDLDIALRKTIAAINRSRDSGERVTLSLFPTPGREYFLRCVNDRACKPHLISIARQVLGVVPRPSQRKRTGGWLFMRFMLAGFAAHRALESLGVEVLESYPYLAFALWKKKNELLPAKSDRRAALAARQRILARLAREGALSMDIPQTLDEADAAVLAITATLSARDNRGALCFESIEHGRFMLPLGSRDLAALQVANVLDRA